MKRENEIRLYDLFFYLLSKWKIIFVTLAFAGGMAVGLYYVDGSNVQAPKGLTQERRDLLDVYSNIIAKTIDAEAMMSEETREMDSVEFSTLESIVNIEKLTRSLITDKTEIDYLNKRIQAIISGSEYTYVAPAAQRSARKEIFAVVFLVSIVIIYLIIDYFKRNPFIYIDMFGWNQYLIYEYADKKNNLIKRIRFKDESVYSIFEAINIISTIMKISGFSSVSLRGELSEKLREKLAESFSGENEGITLKEFSRKYDDEKAVVDYYSSDAFIIVQKADDRIDSEFIHEYDQNAFLQNKPVFVLTII